MLSYFGLWFNYYKTLQQIKGCNTVTFSEIILESSMEKLVENSWWRLAVITKTGGLPCAMWLLMKRFSELHALGLFDAVFKLMLREDLRLSELNLLVNWARGFSWVFGIFSFSIAAREDINLVHGLFDPWQQDWRLHQSVRLFPQ